MYGAQAGAKPPAAAAAPPGKTVTVGAAAPAGKATLPARRGKNGGPVKEMIPMSDEAVALKVALQAAQENVQHYKERVRLL